MSNSERTTAPLASRGDKRAAARLSNCRYCAVTTSKATAGFIDGRRSETVGGTSHKRARALRQEFKIGKVQYYTLLQLAASQRNIGAIKLLLRYGADVRQRGRISESALHIAVQQGPF